MTHRLKNILLTILKLVFALGALAFVLRRTDAKEIASHISSSNYAYLVMAFFALNIAIVTGAFRLRAYLKCNGLELSPINMTRLYYVGMFFNTVLPGGIGGDGYLAIYFKKKFHFSAKTSVRLLLTARANGLFFCNFFLFLFAWDSGFSSKYPEVKPAILILFAAQIPVYFFVAKKILSEKYEVFARAGCYSIISQTFFVLAAYFVYTGVGIQGNMGDYLVMYLAAAIASVLPISPGGVGIREIIMYKGSEMLGLNPEQAVAASLVYFGIYVIASLTGLVFYLTGNKIPAHIKK